MKRPLVFTFVAFIIVIGLPVCVHEYSVKRRYAEYCACVASKVETTDSLSLQKALLDTSFIAGYTELNDSSLRQYIDDWYGVSKVHQSQNTDTNLTLLYKKVIDFYNRRIDPEDILYNCRHFSKENIIDSSDFFVIPENVRIHKLRTLKKDKEWYRYIDACSDSIAFDVPVIDNGRPVLYLSDANETILSNYLSRKDSYDNLRQYIPVNKAGDVHMYYRFYSAPIITDIYCYNKDILISVVISGYYGEELLLRDGEEELKVLSSWVV